MSLGERGFLKIKTGDLGASHTVLLHLWKWEPDDNMTQNPISWTLFYKHSPFDEAVGEGLDRTVYLRETVWDIGQDLRISQNTAEQSRRYDPTFRIRELPLDHPTFEDLIKPLTGIAIPIIGVKKLYYMGQVASYGISIQDYATDGVTFTWKNEGPAEWDPLIKWSLELMDQLAQTIDAASADST